MQSEESWGTYNNAQDNRQVEYIRRMGGRVVVVIPVVGVLN